MFALSPFNGIWDGLLLCVKIVSLFLQFGGKWQLDAVALLREMLLNRTVDMDVKVELLRCGAF